MLIKDLRTVHGLDRLLRSHVNTDTDFMKKHVSDIEMKNKFYTLNDDIHNSYKSYDSGLHFNESYKLSSLAGYDDLCPKTPYEAIVMPASVHRGGYKGRRGRGGNSANHQNGANVFNTQFDLDKNGYATNEQQQQQQQHDAAAAAAQYSVPPSQGYMEAQFNYAPADNVIAPAQPQYYTTTPWNENFNSTGYYHQQNLQAPQTQQLTPQFVNYGHPQMFANPQHFTYVTPMTNVSVPPPPIYSMNNGFGADPLIRPIDLNSTTINYNAKNSYDVNGKDLPSKLLLC